MAFPVRALIELPFSFLLLAAVALLAAVPSFSDAFSAKPSPPAYLVIEARITDPAKFASYARSVPAVVSSFGGEYLVLGGRHEPLEGEWGETRVVLQRWPDGVDSARRFWKSDEYAAVKKLREGTGEFRIVMLEGLEEDVGEL
mmetsp:Transcript_32473/g.97240  ORF Transcript_32473/g.97240 Transcript_32473/m.97240 type:complete len:143 (-) Transcript_32473:438-866(-)